MFLYAGADGLSTFFIRRVVVPMALNAILWGFGEGTSPGFRAARLALHLLTKGENTMRDSSDVWTGTARSYDRARPTPPPALLDLLTQVIGLPHPTLVVDVGSGTGLSTTIWGERAERVIGIEPNADMRQEAIRKLVDHPYAAHVEYRAGVAQQ